MKLITFEKKLGLPGAVCVTIGAVIGVGIFVIVGPFGALARVWMQWLSLQRPYPQFSAHRPLWVQPCIVGGHGSEAF